MTEIEQSVLTHRHLVIVDPFVDDYRCLIPSAQELKLRFTLTSSGAGALRLASAHPDAIWIVSKALPDMDGLQLLEMLRSLLKDATTIVVDTQHCESSEVRIRSLGADHYLQKPFQLRWLQDCRGPSQKSSARLERQAHSERPSVYHPTRLPNRLPSNGRDRPP